MLARMTGLFRNLIVYPDRMQKNMALTGGLYHSEAVMLGLVKKGLSRQVAYKITQSIAMACFRDGLNFIECCKKNEELKEYLTKEEIAALTDDRHYFEHIETIFARLF